MNAGSWRVGIRVARRSALRSKGRTLLIAAMVGLPITGLVAADTLYRTAQLSPDQRVERMFGQADFVASESDKTGGIFLSQLNSRPVTDAAKARRGFAELRATGATVTPFGSGGVQFDTELYGKQATTLRVTDLTSPLVDGAIVRRTGAVPSAPDEAVASPEFLRLAEAKVGETVTFEDDTKVRIVGTAVDPQSLGSSLVVVAPGSVLEKETSLGVVPMSLVGTAPGATEDQVTAVLESSGLAYASRASLRSFPLESQEGALLANADEVGTGVVVVGLAGLQIVLLASAAFAVGARRQRRDLGLVAAQGGARKDVRRIVLASALVIGTAASVAGVGLGIVIAALLRGPIEARGYELFGPFEIAPTDLLVIVAIGVATALLAAAVPAWTASRVSVLAALSGRRGVTRTPRRLTAVALVAVIGGFLMAGAGARSPANYNLILAGAVIAELGFALCAPALIGLAGRLAQWFPLTLRLAFRDSARNRGRSAPAVAAIMAALAATVGLSVYLVSDDARNEAAYMRSLPGHMAQAYPTDGLPNAFAGREGAAVKAAVAAALPGGRSVDLVTLGGCASEKRCTYVYGDVSEYIAYGSGIGVGDASTIAKLTGREPDERIRAALADGKAVVLGDVPIEDIRLHIERIDNEQPIEPNVVKSAILPAVFAAVPMYPGLPVAVVSPATAERLGTGVRSESALWVADGDLSDDDIRAGNAAAVNAGADITLYRERGYESQIGLTLLALVGVSTLVTVGATAIATGLAGVESRPDLATLAAVGASPRIRRLLAMAQAASVALTGALLGVLAGLVPAYAILDARVDYPFIVPWTVVGLVVVAVPTIAALLAGLFTRSRLPMNARIE